MSTIVENTMFRANNFAQEKPSWQKAMVDYAELISNERNAELLEMNNELLEALKECQSFLKRVQSPATASLFLSQSLSNLIQKHTKK